MHNRAFWRAAHSLAHPVILIAIVLLLVNDHWLRHEYPSWLTGKLGDWTWLMFAPFIAALLFAWIVPRRLPRQEQLVGILAFAFVGCWFALAKTVPFFHQITTTTLDAIVGWEGTLRLDPTDLITLPALLPAWLIWQQAKNTEPELSPRVWIMLALGVMSTLATSYAPSDVGLISLCRTENQIYALSYLDDVSYSYHRNIYTTTDGGLTWQSINSFLDLDNCQPNNRSNRLDSLTSYRFVPGVGIFWLDADKEISVMELDLSETLNNARQEYYNYYRWSPPCSGSKFYFPGPHDALFDHQTGNLIVAMGLEGVLVRSVGGEWQRVSVGCYHPIDEWEIQGIIQLIEPELITALMLLMLMPGYIVLATRNDQWDTGCLLAISLLGGGVMLLLGRIVHYSYWSLLIPLALVLFVIGWYLNFVVIGQYGLRWRSLLPLGMIAVLTVGIALLYLLPYIMWMRGTINDYGTATGFAFMLVLSGIVGANQYIGRRFPPGKKKKIDELFLPEE